MVVRALNGAARIGDQYILNGEKMWISLADVAANFLFFCWTDERNERKRDIPDSCFIVERGIKGFTSGTIHGKLGIRAGNTGYFSLQDTPVSKEHLSAKEGGRIQNRDVRARAGEGSRSRPARPG